MVSNPSNPDPYYPDPRRTVPARPSASKAPAHVHDESSNRGLSSSPRPVQPAPSQPIPGGGGRLNLLLSWAAWRPDPWTAALPRLLEPMGVASLHARSAREAERLIRDNPVHIAVVDLSLPLDAAPASPNQPTQPPEDGGPRILDLLFRLDSPPPTVIIKTPRGLRDESRHMNAALRCGAFAVVDRSRADLETMLGVMQRCLARFYQNRWPHR